MSANGRRYYFAVDVRPPGEPRIGVVLFCTERAIDLAKSRHTAGYVGCETFTEAERRAGMMQRAEAGAYGPISHTES